MHPAQMHSAGHTSMLHACVAVPGFLLMDGMPWGCGQGDSRDSKGAGSKLWDTSQGMRSSAVLLTSPWVSRTGLSWAAGKKSAAEVLVCVDEGRLGRRAGREILEICFGKCALALPKVGLLSLRKGWRHLFQTAWAQPDFLLSAAKQAGTPGAVTGTLLVGAGPSQSLPWCRNLLYDQKSLIVKVSTEGVSSGL